MKRWIILLALLGSAGCALRYYSAALGNYDEFRPDARLRATSLDVELARPAYVAVIGITTPGPGYQERPVLFEPIYPRWDTDETHFAAGRHHIVSRRQTLRDPANCRDDQKPTLSGCRRAPHLYPGVGSHIEVDGIYVADPGHYMVIASEDFVDPYTLADDLFEVAFEREEFAAALKTDRAQTAANNLERALLDRPGSFVWSALYVSGR